MSPVELTLAVLVLLLTPGPTNTLVLLAGAERGLAGAVRLIPAEVLGYSLTVLPLVLAGGTYLDANPQVRTLVVLAASAWVAVLAVRLWHLPVQLAEGPTVGPRALFVTTALNPKALIFGLVLLPSPDRLATNLAVFVGLVVVVALLWAGLGAALRQGGIRRPETLTLLRRVASVWLAVISVTLALRGAAA